MHGFAGDCGLSLGDQRTRALGQIDVDAGAEADHADALTGGDRLAFAHERHDAPRHQTRDLNDGDARGRSAVAMTKALRSLSLARLVEIGAEEFAGAIDDALDAAGDAGCGSRGSRTRS